MRKSTARWMTGISCTSGILLVAYGMAAKNDYIFLVGIGLVILGYLLIRRKLKRPPLEHTEQ